MGSALQRTPLPRPVPPAAALAAALFGSAEGGNIPPQIVRSRSLNPKCWGISCRLVFTNPQGTVPPTLTAWPIAQKLLHLVPPARSRAQIPQWLVVAIREEPVNPGRFLAAGAGLDGLGRG